MSSSSPARAAVVASLALALATPAASPAQQELPVFGAEVQVVAVPIFVTGKDGKGIAGLTAADFEIEDQGKQVPVVAFLAIDAGSPTIPTEAGPVTGAAARRQFLFLFDLTFSTATGVTRAREAAVEFLRKGLGPNDLVAVASIRPEGPQVLVGFTPDVAQASQAIATLGAVSGERLRDPLGLALDLGIKLDDPTGSFGILPSAARGKAGVEDYRDLLMQLSRADRNAYSQRVVSYVANLAGLGQLLNSVQGRKQVILLSAGFDQSVLTGARGVEQAESSRAVTEGRLWDVQSESHFGDAGARSEMESLTRALAGADVVVHTVDVAGLTAGGDLSELGPVRPGSGKESLAQIAEGSGGRFITDTNNLAQALQEVLDASRYYYVLAFEPVASKKKPGELHKLKIKVKRDGLDVSHRSGYTLPDPKLAAAPVRQLQAAEVIAKGLSGGSIGIEALAVPYRGSGGRVSLPVVLQVDGASLLGKDAKGTLAVEIYGYALDGRGRILDALGVSPTLDLAQLGDAIRQKGIQVLTSFRVVPGPVDLRFLVRSPATGRAGSLRVQLEVPAFAGDALVVSSPLVTDDPRARIVIPSASRANPQLEIPFRLGETPFTADAAPAFKNGEAREVCLMAWSGAGVAERRLTAELVGASGQAIAVEADASRLVKDADGFARYVTSLTPKGVPKGDYRLRLSLADAAGGATTQSELAVRVE